MDLEKEIEQIKLRNKKVEIDKAWETSWTRKICIMILTYIVVIVYSYIIKNTLGNESISKKLIEEDCIGNYELENMLAILSCCVDEPKTKIIIGILSKPILWNKKKVQLVIIPLIGKNIGIKILDLYKELSYFADNSNYIKRIIKKQNQEEIIKIFNDIELKI